MYVPVSRSIEGHTLIVDYPQTLSHNAVELCTSDSTSPQSGNMNVYAYIVFLDLS